MRIAEVNRLFQWFEDSRLQKDIATCLAYVAVGTSSTADALEGAVFEKNIMKYFPDPFSRAAVLKQLLLTSSDEGEEAKSQCAKEQSMLLSLFLAACVDLFERSVDFEAAKADFRSLTDFTKQDAKFSGN